MDLLDYEIKDGLLIEEEDSIKNEKMVRDINYGIMEGLIELEVDDNGEIRAYPVSG